MPDDDDTTCPECDGSGWVARDDPWYGTFAASEPDDDTCDTCDGQGEL